VQYVTPPTLENMVEQQIIEICPLAYMRGRTFENAWIICGEWGWFFRVEPVVFEVVCPLSRHDH
jgi:hypothetical protein